jgi:hypothetical protein
MQRAWPFCTDADAGTVIWLLLLLLLLLLVLLQIPGQHAAPAAGPAGQQGRLQGGHCWASQVRTQ